MSDNTHPGCESSSPHPAAGHEAHESGVRASSSAFARCSHGASVGLQGPAASPATGKDSNEAVSSHTDCPKPGHLRLPPLSGQARLAWLLRSHAQGCEAQTAKGLWLGRQAEHRGVDLLP